MNKKIFVVGGKTTYANWMEGEIVNKKEHAQLIVFTGGTDVSPTLYGEQAHPSTDDPDTVRDSNELIMFQWARDNKIPMVGICRGAQFLCVMAGGKLVQHQQEWGGHYMQTKDGRSIYVSSDHHQAQYPWGLPRDNFEVLSWTKDLASFHEGGNEEEMVSGVLPDPIEVEDVYYSKINALGIQSHPEWLFVLNRPEVIESIAYHRSLLAMLFKD